MRALIVNPLVLAVSAVLGVALCRALHLDPHLHELAIAAGICLAAVEAAVVPLLVYRGIMHAAQAALLATVAHLMIATMAAGGVIMTLHPPIAFLYWLFAFYAVTLVIVCVEAARVVRSATPPAGDKVTTATTTTH